MRCNAEALNREPDFDLELGFELEVVLTWFGREVDGRVEGEGPADAGSPRAVKGGDPTGPEANGAAGGCTERICERSCRPALEAGGLAEVLGVKIPCVC